MSLESRRSNTAEIRFETDQFDLAVLDGYCAATGKNRTDVIRSLLSEWSDKKHHEANLIIRVAGANPNRAESAAMGEAFDLFANDPLSVAQRRSGVFRADFLPWLEENQHLYCEFERLSLQMARHRDHYGARSIVEKMRYDMTISERGGEFKINGNFVPCMARLFSLCNPNHAGLFEFREHKAAA